MSSLLLSSFHVYLYQLGYGNSTRETLPRLVEEFLQQQEIRDVRQVDPAAIKAFYGGLQERPLKKRVGGLSNSMIYQYMYALSLFFGWLELTEQLEYNPISGLRFKRLPSGTREPLSCSEVQELFKAAETLTERAVLHLFYSLGLRRSEGEALNRADVRFREQLLYVRAGKGAKRRVVPMTAKVAQELEGYFLQERCSERVKQVSDEGAFVLNRRGGRLRGAGLNELVKRVAERAGIRKPCTPHCLRHSIATHLLQGGMKLEQVREFLGHVALETTQGYAKIAPAQLLAL